MSFYKGNNMVAGIPEISQSVTDGDVNAVSADAVYTALGDRTSAGSLLDMVAAANAVANAGVAPGGCGLGEQIATLFPPNNNVNSVGSPSGVYRFDDTTLGGVPGRGNGVSGIVKHFVVGTNPLRAVQTLVYLQSQDPTIPVGTVVRRFYDPNIYVYPQAWEYVNPPLVAGTEYRTTERWHGKPVYVKNVDCGTGLTSATDNGRKAVAHNVANVQAVIDCSGVVAYQSIPIYSTDSQGNLGILTASADTNYVRLYTNITNFSSNQIWVTIKYTKTTD